MVRLGAIASVFLLADFALAQSSSSQSLPIDNTSVPPTQAVAATPVFVEYFAEGDTTSGLLIGDRMFPNFIGFMSNPILNVDPRAMTSLWPIIGNVSFSSLPALPSGNETIGGAGITVALSDRFAVGMSQGGYSWIDLSQGNGTYRDRDGQLHNQREFQGSHEGWLNLGGFFQYTLIADAEAQFLLTGGLHWTAPSGTLNAFQGFGPAKLTPYATIGKAWGNVHLLATTGYEFPLGSGGSGMHLFYANFHLDRQFGWLYPLVELNCTYHQSSVDLDLPTRDGLMGFGNFGSSGNIVTMAVGANAVIVANKLELGAIYMTPIATQRDFSFDGVLVKMVYRY